MAIVLIESYSAVFFAQISSQNREANVTRPTGESYSLVKPKINWFRTTKQSTDLFRMIKP